MIRQLAGRMGMYVDALRLLYSPERKSTEDTIIHQQSW